MSNAHSTDNNNNINKPEAIEHLDCVQRMSGVSYIVLVITTSHKSDFMKKYDRVETDVIQGDYKFSLAFNAVLKAHRYLSSDAVLQFRMTAFDAKNYRVFCISRFKDFLSCMVHETKEFIIAHGNNSEDGVHSGWDKENNIKAWYSYNDAVAHEHNIFIREGDIALWEAKQKENIEYADASELYKTEDNSEDNNG